MQLQMYLFKIVFVVYFPCSNVKILPIPFWECIHLCDEIPYL